MDTPSPKMIIGGLVVFLLIAGGIIWLTSPGGGPAENILEEKPESIDDQLNTNQNTMTNDEATKEQISATITTNKGDIMLELYPKAAPLTVQNFMEKAKAKYFDGLKFHRVEDWVIQGGDPLSKDEAKRELWGTGGGNIPTEQSSLPFSAGALGVARGGDIKVSNDSQFFIVKKDSQFLNNQYTLFGQVVGGIDIVNSTEVGDEILTIRIGQ